MRMVSVQGGRDEKEKEKGMLCLYEYQYTSARTKARSTGGYLLLPQLLDSYKKLKTDEEYFSLSLIIYTMLNGYSKTHMKCRDLKTSRIL